MRKKVLEDIIHGETPELKNVIFSASEGWLLITSTGKIKITNDELLNLVKKGLAITMSKRRYQDKLNEYYNNSSEYRQKRHDIYLKRRNNVNIKKLSNQYS